MKNPLWKNNECGADHGFTFMMECRLMFGGFGGVGSPPTIIDGILNKGYRI